MAGAYIPDLILAVEAKCLTQFSQFYPICPFPYLRAKISKIG